MAPRATSQIECETRPGGLDQRSYRFRYPRRHLSLASALSTSPGDRQKVCESNGQNGSSGAQAALIGVQAGLWVVTLISTSISLVRSTGFSIQVTGPRSGGMSSCGMPE